MAHNYYSISFTFVGGWLMLKPMSWFYLALLSPLLYAVVNLLDDNLLSFVYKSPYLAAASAGFYGSLPLLSRFFISTHGLPTSLAELAFCAGLLTLAYYFFYFKGLAADTPAIVIALFSLVPATIPFLAHFIVHERLMSLEIVGFVIVLVASAGLAVTDLRHFKFSKAIVPICIAVVLLDAISLMTKYVYQRADFYPAYLYFSAGMGVGGVGFFLLRFNENRRTVRDIAKKIKKLLPVFIVAELLGLAAEFTLNLAISRGPVSLVKGIEGIQPMFVLLISLVLYPFAPKYFREAKAGNRLKKFILIAVDIVGLVIISIAAKI